MMQPIYLNVYRLFYFKNPAVIAILKIIAYFFVLTKI